MKISEKKFERLLKLSNNEQIIAALAIDQRGAIEKMVPSLSGEERTSFIKKYKKLVSKELTKYSSSILLDPIYGLEAIQNIDENSGLLIAYEITGYRDDNRKLELTPNLSVRRISELEADAVKVLLYYDVDDTDENNEPKKAEIERIGAECKALDIPFFLEILTYDNNYKDSDSKEFAKVKPRKVNEAMRIFSDERYGVDVLKVEVPVNMKFVEGFGEEALYTKEEAKLFFKKQSESTNLPYIFLSAGVSTKLFQETLRFAKDSGAEFHGVLCGRATWKGGVAELEKGEQQSVEWLRTEGKRNIISLNEVLKITCTPWTTRLQK